jgi:hypothetical protein
MRFGINAISVMTGGNVTYFANILQEMAQLLEARGDTLFVYTRKDGRVTVPGSPALREMPIAPQGLSAGRGLGAGLSAHRCGARPARCLLRTRR